MASAEHNPLPPQEIKQEAQARQTHVESRWLSVEQIRKQQRCRRSVVITAMESGALPYEQRGRIRYARICDIEAWEQSRLKAPQATTSTHIHPDLEKFF